MRLLWIFLLIPVFASGCLTWTVREEKAVIAFNRGNAWREEGNMDAAVEEYLKALRFDPAFNRAMFNLAFVELERGFPQASLKYLQKLLDQDPQNLTLHRAFAWVYWEQEDGESALDWYQRGLEIFEGDILSLKGALGILKSQQRYEEALPYQERLDYLEDSVETKTSLAGLLKDLGREEEAVQVYESLLIRSAGEDASRMILADIYASRKDYESAEYHLDLIARKGGESAPEAHWKLARIYLLYLAYYEDGEKALETALAGGFEDAEAQKILLQELPAELFSSIQELFEKRTKLREEAAAAAAAAEAEAAAASEEESTEEDEEAPAETEGAPVEEVPPLEESAPPDTDL